MSKHKVCLSIDEKIVSGISAAASKRGIPISEVAERYFSKGLAKDSEITAAERFFFQRDNIEKSLDNVLIIFGVSMKGGLTDKFQTLIYLSMQKSRQKNRQSRYAVIELSIFEILNNVKDMDTDLFAEWITEMAKHGRIRDRYFKIYPK